jgi:hypothetical protein
VIKRLIDKWRADRFVKHRERLLVKGGDGSFTFVDGLEGSRFRPEAL